MPLYLACMSPFFPNAPSFSARTQNSELGSRMPRQALDKFLSKVDGSPNRLGPFLGVLLSSFCVDFWPGPYEEVAFGDVLFWGFWKANPSFL